MRGIVRVAIAAAIALAPSVASAADTWTEPHPGMRMLARSTSSPNWRIWALQIDLCAPGVSLRATKSGERKRTVSSFAGLVEADAAINGDFFSFSTYATSGLSVGAGEPWSDTSDSNGMGFVVFGNDRAEIKLPGSSIPAADTWMKQLVSGRRRLVDEGTPMGSDGSDLCDVRHPRTAAGMSRDGRTLILAVVDGRTSISVGMTCAELGTLMADLGAFSAINLDGGGSSSMWVRGSGVVNSPSDGTQRIVANHLGVFASGDGDPGSCDRSWEEAAVHGDAYDASPTSDIDGDGDADLCVRTQHGIECALAQDGALTASVAGPALSDESGWDDPSNWSTLRMGDLDGDGKADLCARANAGVRCWRSLGTGFEDRAIEGPALADDVGWSAAAYHGTLRMADIDGDGRDDLCARSAADFRCWPSTGDGFADPWIVPDLADANGWDDPSRYGTIRMADIDADHRVDLCARAAEGLRCWPSTGAGFGAPIDGPAWSDAAGWTRPEYWSTIRLVDLDGDHRADACARTAQGIACHLATATGFASDPIAGPAWSDESGWADYDNYSTIRFVDLDGDDAVDVCGRANAGIVCHRFFGDAFEPDPIMGPALSNDTGWSNARFYATIRFVDLDADGDADLCARTGAGIQCWPFDDTAFGDPWIGPAWSDDAGFSAPAYYETLRGARPMARCRVDEICNGVDDNCDGTIDEGCDPGDLPTDDAGDDAPSDADSDFDPDDPRTDPVDPALPQGYGADDASSCACAATPRSHAAWPWLCLVLPIALRRKRIVGRRV